MPWRRYGPYPSTAYFAAWGCGKAAAAWVEGGVGPQEWNGFLHVRSGCPVNGTATFITLESKTPPLVAHTFMDTPKLWEGSEITFGGVEADRA